MAKFAYNNSKNASTGHISFELNCGYHFCVSFKDECDIRSRSSFAKRQVMELGELMDICCQNLLYAQNLQKQVYNKEVKLWSYIPSEKVWLNSKYIKTKKNQKLKTKFFRLFQVLHPVGKQAYKLELLVKYKTHNIFHVSLLE